MNEKLCLVIWRFYSALRLVLCFLLLIPAAIFKNLLAIVAGILHLTLVVIFLLTAIWIILLLPLLLFSWMSMCPAVGWVFAIFGLPFALVAEIILQFMPSFSVLRDPNDGNARAYWRKVVMAESFPFSMEFSPFGKRLKRRMASKMVLVSFEQTPIIKDFLPDDLYGDGEWMLDGI